MICHRHDALVSAYLAGSGNGWKIAGLAATVLSAAAGGAGTVACAMMRGAAQMAAGGCGSTE
jgi:hypothetical protein